MCSRVRVLGGSALLMFVLVQTAAAQQLAAPQYANGPAFYDPAQQQALYAQQAMMMQQAQMQQAQMQHAQMMLQGPMPPNPYVQQASYGQPQADGPAPGEQCAPELAESPSFGWDDSCYFPEDDACWIGTVSAVYMTRQHEESRPLITDGLTGTGATLLDASNFDFDYKPGADVSLRHVCSCDWSVDVRYLWIDSFDAERSFTDADGNFTVHTTPTNSVSVVAPASISARYLSEIQTGEIGLRRNYGRIGLTYGFRFVDLNERFQITYVNGANTVRALTYTTRNEMYGFQLGADGYLFRGERFKLGGFGKAGVYANVANSDYNGGVVGGNTFGVSANETTQVAFLGEVGLTGVYFLSDHCALRGGYQLMWLSGVAVAGEQVAANSGLDNPVTSTINTTGDLFYHGFNAGLEFVW